MKQLELDSLIERLFTPINLSRGSQEHWQHAPEQCQQWQHIFDLLQQLKAKKQVDGIHWPSIWLSVPRETWAEVCALDEADEGETSDYDDDAQTNWLLEYPYDPDWLRASFVLSDDTLFFGLLPKEPRLLLRLEQKTVDGLRDLADADGRAGFQEYTDWATTELRKQLERLLANPDAYMDTLDQQLPKRERFGKLRRRDLWNCAPNEEHFLRNELSQQEVARFSTVTPQLAADQPLSDLTLNAYLRFCAICYEGADYALHMMTPREQYLARADGRHDGLLDIEPDSPDALADWFSVGQRGGHPWEIARGGNTTHISLFLTLRAGDYYLSLAGSAHSRAAETIRMSLALWTQGVPFTLHQADHLSRMANGEDWIGIVPHYYRGAAHYSAGEFPAEDQIHDVLSFTSLAEYCGLEEWVEWYALERFELA